MNQVEDIRMYGVNLVDPEVKSIRLACEMPDTAYHELSEKTINRWFDQTTVGNALMIAPFRVTNIVPHRTTMGRCRCVLTLTGRRSANVTCAIKDAGTGEWKPGPTYPMLQVGDPLDFARHAFRIIPEDLVLGV